MRMVAKPGRWVRLGAVVFLGWACKTFVPDPAQETQWQIVDLTQRLEQRLVLGKCLPSTMDEWMSEDASVRKYAKDGWGNFIVLRVGGRNVTVVSAGFDGVFGSGDDVEGHAVVTPHEVESCTVPTPTRAITPHPVPYQDPIHAITPPPGD